MKTKFLQRVVWLMIPLLTIFTTNVWGEIYFSDKFSNVGSNSNSYTTRTGWTLSNTYAHYNSGIRLGTSGGYATKSGMSSISGTKDVQVTVYVAKWNNDASSLVVTVNGTARIDGNSSKTFSSIVKTTSTGGAVTWNSSYLISFIVTGATSSTTIKFGTNASGSRAILGPIRISDPAEDCGVFYESWDKCTGTGGNDGSWSGSIATGTLTADNTGWTVANGNGASKCAKFGTGSKKGSAQTPAITYTGSNNLVLTFKAGAWNGGSEGTTLNLSATNATLDKSSVTLTKGAWTTYTVNITSITSGFKIKWEAKNASNNRFFLDDICISEKIISCEVPTAATKGTFNRSTQVMPINWTSTAEKVDVCYSTSSTTPAATPSASYTVVSDQTSSPVNLNVADKAAGNYYCWVRSVCDAENKSDWVAITGSYFTIPTHTLTVTASPTGSGTFTKSPDVTSVVEGRTVSITANPAAGYVFSSWAVSGTDATLSSTTTNPTTFTMGTDNATVTATFVSLSSIAVQTPPTKTAYLEGETFDPTGLVITRTYSNSTSDTYTYAGHTAEFTFSPTTATALTTSNTSVTITYGGQSVTQSINVYSVTVQAKDENDDAIAAGGPGSPTFTVATRGITPAADAANYKFWKWTISGAELGSAATTKTNTITNPTGNVTVTAVYYLPRTVTWLVNGEEWKPYTDAGSGTDGTAVVTKGVAWSTLTLPSDPAPPCGDKFVGWTIVDIGSAGQATDAGLDLMTSANKSDKTGAGHNVNDNITFHAVFADYVE